MDTSVPLECVYINISFGQPDTQREIPSSGVVFSLLIEVVQKQKNPPPPTKKK